MKTALIILGVCFVVVCGAGSLVLMNGARANRDLQEANRKLREDLRAEQAKSDSLAAENQVTAKQLELAGELSENLKARIAEIETTSAKEGENGDTVPTVAPFPAQAYLGQKLLGQAWIIPKNLRKDPANQRYVYDPVVWLDEKLRGSFVIHHTNVVEREIETQTQYNTTYYPQPVYFVSSPFRHRHGTNASPPTPSLPAVPIFKPGNGTVIPQQLGTPAAQIKTRPQLLGQAANSIKTSPQEVGIRNLTP